MMIVMTLLALVMFLALPAFQNLVQSSLDKEINRLTGVVRLLRNEAILTRKPFRLVFDMKKGNYSVQEKIDGKYELRSDPKILDLHQFPSSFVLNDIVVFGKRYNRMEDHQVPINIDSSGFLDSFLIHFTASGKTWTLKVSGFTAKMALEEGHVEYRAERS